MRARGHRHGGRNERFPAHSHRDREYASELLIIVSMKSGADRVSVRAQIAQIPSAVRPIVEAARQFVKLL